MTLSLIVAIARNGVIGKDGVMPWQIPEDMRHFKAVTMGHTLIVGRKTYDGLPVLSGRRIVMVSRRCSAESCGHGTTGFRHAATIEDAITVARETDPEPIVIGGAEVYRAAMPYVSRIYLTEIDRDVDGDTRFDLDRTGFVETERRQGEERDVAFVTLERRLP
jgi:dihydrofolate reductase